MSLCKFFLLYFFQILQYPHDAISLSSLFFTSSLYTGPSTNITHKKSCAPFPGHKQRHQHQLPSMWGSPIIYVHSNCSFKSRTWSMPHETERHLCKATQSNLSPFLPTLLSPPLLSSFIFLTPSSPLSVIHTILLFLASYITALLLQDHICTSLSTCSLDLICYTSFICVILLVCHRNRAFIPVVPNRQTNK